MKTYKIGLTRTYVVTIKAENKNSAKRLSEYYLGDFADLSTEKDKRERKFSIEDIEMVYNEAQTI